MGVFDGLVALVTGRGSGIGRSAAELLAGLNTGSIEGTAGLPQPHGWSMSAEAIACLAGPLSGSTTGTVLAVDGGVDALRLCPRG